MSSQLQQQRASVTEIVEGLSTGNYIASTQIATALLVARHLCKPILVEGPAGVGKTELALATSGWLKLPLIRLQCYEGLDESKALYEWKYGKQLLYTQILKEKLGDILQGARGLKQSMAKLHDFGDSFFSEHFLQPRPLLQALQYEEGAVLLIDEIDKSDEEFEAFLLEVLSDFQISIPELGTVKAKTPPIVFLTSNNTREIGDALKRRCLHLYIDFPNAKLERQIIAARAPGIEEKLLKQLVAFVQQLRTKDLKKLPSVSETIDWARVMLLLNAERLDHELVRDTLNVLLKFEDDIKAMTPHIRELTRLSAQEAGFHSHAAGA